MQFKALLMMHMTVDENYYYVGGKSTLWYGFESFRRIETTTVGGAL